MSSPKKFRVWDPEEEVMYDPPHAFYLDGWEDMNWRTDDGLVPARTAKSTFSTGLTDAKGTPIYEGDVVEQDIEEAEPLQFVVVWIQEASSFGLTWLTDIDDPPGYHHLTEELSNRLRVIGNRYEDPELID